VSRRDEQEIEIHASAAAVWKALTDADALANWLTESARVEPAAGGLYRVSFGDGAELEAHIEEWQPGRRLRLVPHLPTGAEPIVEEYLLEERGEVTVLRLVTSGIPDSPSWDGFLEGTRKGRWLALLGLRHWLERRPGQRRQLTRIDLDTSLGPREAWARAVGPDGLHVGEDFEGEVLGAFEAYGLLAVIHALDDGLLALGVQLAPGGSRVWLSLATFGQRAPAAQGLERRLRAALQHALGKPEGAA
jgi:uncharacterized protein YndB with AHSA1/START domain